ncbi:MAG: response regulator [Helicobacteraceae bacterium]|nr:response regulator [Helicobacteraceae bacterium]
MRVLIVEDNEFNQMVLTDMLELLYPQMEIEVEDGAVETLQRSDLDSFDLVLSDIDMPTMNGYELYIELREKRAFKNPVIAVTALAIKGDKEQMLEHGFDDYISKPINIDLLKNVVDKFIV